MLNCRETNFKSKVLPLLSQPGFFNLTSTFRNDSDFPTPYLYFKRKNTTINSNNNNNNDEITVKLSKRKKLMVWFVSHCETDSKREKYIEELSKYIKVDIYGKCGRQEACGERHTSNCVNVSMNEYKFYFAGENTICREYFTGGF